MALLRHSGEEDIFLHLGSWKHKTSQGDGVPAQITTKEIRKMDERWEEISMKSENPTFSEDITEVRLLFALMLLFCVVHSIRLMKHCCPWCM